MARILVVDDEPRLRKIVALFLAEQGHDVSQAASGEEALAMPARPPFDLVLLDFNLPGINGLETLTAWRDRDPSPIFIFITAFGTIRSAVEAMQAGAFDYITKPFDNDDLLLTINRALDVRRLNAEVVALRHELASRYGFTDIVGVGAAMRSVFNIMNRVSDNDVTVLILGESGTGKELAARGIHRKSRRAKGPFVPVNCSAIPSTMVEAEFFGYERGAFTDAKESHAGTFEHANRGTIFLDEIGDLALDAQAKLLRVLQDHEVTRLGSHRAIPVDVRVIAATNKDLEKAVATGRFREDLYWRLNVVTFRLPPLRERIEDLPTLIDHLVERINRELGGKITAMSNEARRLMVAYAWPGNVRELENALRRALVLADGPVLAADDLPPRVRAADGRTSATHADGGEILTLAEAVQRTGTRVERALLQEALEEFGGNRTAMAQRLGVSRKTLFNKMREYGLIADDAQDSAEINT